jgi:MFS family permease
MGYCLHVSGLHAQFRGAVRLLFILGLVEGSFLPGVFFLMSCWYKRSELPPRIALLYGANMLDSAFGGLIAAGIVARMEGKMVDQLG